MNRMHAHRVPAPLALPTAALAPLGNASTRPGSVLALPSGSITSNFRALGVDRGRRTATYQLEVTNDSMSPVSALAYAVDGDGPPELMSWNTVTIPPYKSINVTLDFPLVVKEKEQRVFVELHSEHARLTLDGMTPGVVRGSGVSRRVVAAVAAAAALLLGGAGYAAGKPHVYALAAPKSVTAGAVFDIAYAASDFSQTRYSVETPDGERIWQGVLPKHSGTLAIRLPLHPDSRGYDIRVASSSPLGTDARTAHVVAIGVLPATKPQAAPRTAQIVAMSLHHDNVGAGDPIVVNYRTVGTAGTIMLLDQNDTVHARAIMTHHGQTVLIAPTVPLAQEFRVVLQVTRGASTAESSVGVHVAGTRAPRPTGPPPDQAALGDPSGTPADIPPANIPIQNAAPGDDPFTLTSSTYYAGSTVPITIAHAEAHLHIALSTDMGSELVGVDVEPGQRSLSLRVPSVAQDTKYLIVGTFLRGVSQETVVKAITVRTGAKVSRPAAVIP